MQSLFKQKIFNLKNENLLFLNVFFTQTVRIADTSASRNHDKRPILRIPEHPFRNF